MSGFRYTREIHTLTPIDNIDNIFIHAYTRFFSHAYMYTARPIYTTFNQYTLRDNA